MVHAVISENWIKEDIGFMGCLVQLLR